MEHIYPKREPVDDLADKLIERMNGALKPKASWWSSWQGLVLWIASMCVGVFLTWHEMDKRITRLEDTMNRIEGAVGRIEDQVWPRK